MELSDIIIGTPIFWLAFNVHEYRTTKYELEDRSLLEYEAYLQEWKNESIPHSLFYYLTYPGRKIAYREHHK